MAAQVLGAGMDDQVDAVRERALVHRGGEGAVDDQVRSGAGIPRPGEQRQIGDAQIGIGGGLGEDDLGPTRAQGGPQCSFVGGLHQSGLDAQPGEEPGDELARAAVAVAGEDDVIAALEQLEERGGGRGHAAGEEGGGLRAFQGGHLLLRRADGRVPVAAVLFALEVAGEVPLDLRRVGERIGGGEDNRRGDGVVCLLARLASVDGESGRLRFGRARVRHRGQPFYPPRWLNQKPSRLE